MNDITKKVAAVTLVFALLGLYSLNIKNVVLSDTNALIAVVVAFAGVTSALAFLDQTPGKCFEDKLKSSVNKSVVPTLLLVVLSHPKTYKFVSNNIGKDIIAGPLVKELTNMPTFDGVALHTGVFALSYYFFLTQMAKH